MLPMPRSARRLSLVLACLLTGGVFAGSSHAEIVTERHHYVIAGKAHYGWFVYDDEIATTRPGVMLFHEWWGLNDFAVDQAKRIAENGYVVFCADMYGMNDAGDNIIADNAEDASKLAGELYNDRRTMRNRAAMAYLQTATNPRVDTGNIASVGYCFGGTVALELMRGNHPIKGTVVYHGGLSTPTPLDETSDVKGEVIVLNGNDDPYVSKAERVAFKRELDNASVPYTFVEFSGAKHAFTNPASRTSPLDGVAYDDRATNLAHTMADDFLVRTIGPGEERGEKVTEDTLQKQPVKPDGG